ncbi:glutathione S-transferase-like protein [Protomyces lactucae-debilis]|uniref:glutathione transferase n=1 Tax=Protomyces lactucae-debilis TaxID=2754530 RepID=A0A1Y2FLX4_PROLT|nr:glutathione S-transferase-like protein [Protomyces lactucae-debilis]ORY84970.1 glutathione S-transferase-like protein [Protomyces lactucae-debilis]
MADITASQASKKPLVFHHLEDSRSQRILWLLEELKVPYELKEYKRIGGRAPKELTAVHPLGKSPVITDNGKTIAESGAIVDYIIKKYDTNKTFAPQTEDEELQYNYWLHFAEGTTMTPLVLLLIFDTASKTVPFFVRPLVNGIFGAINKQYTFPECKKNFGFIEQTLQKQAFFAGDRITAADIQMSFPMEICDRAGVHEQAYPAIYAWRKKMGARPAYQAALQKTSLAYAYKL